MTIIEKEQENMAMNAYLERVKREGETIDKSPKNKKKKKGDNVKIQIFREKLVKCMEKGDRLPCITKKQFENLPKKLKKKVMNYGKKYEASLNPFGNAYKSSSIMRIRNV